MLKLIFAADPGRIRLKLATRTLLSAVAGGAAGFLLGPFSVILAVLAGLFCQMSIYGYNAKEKLLHGLVVTLTFCACYSLGTLSKNWTYAPDALLVIAAFAAFYCKRFGPSFAMFPIFSWIMIFMATIFKLPEKAAWMGVGGVALGCAIATVISLVILPERKLELFRRLVIKHLHYAHDTLYWLRKSLLKPTTLDDYNTYLKPKRLTVIELLTQNQTIISEYSLRNKAHSQYLEQFLQYEYSLSKAINIAIDALKSFYFAKSQILINPELRKHLCGLLKSLAHIVDHITLDKDLKLTFKKNVDIPSQLNAFKTCLIQFDIKEQPDLIQFYNCYTSLERFWYNLDALRNLHEA